MNTKKTFILLIFVAGFIILLLRQQQQQPAEESFYPAWHDFQIYSQLSRRVKVGMVAPDKGRRSLMAALNLEGLNADIVLFPTDKDVLHNLLVTKKVDVAVSSEAQYGCYILGQLPAHIVQSKEQILANKHIILQNNPTRRLFTLDTIYHVLVSNFNTFAKLADSKDKIVQVRNLTDATHHLDLALVPKSCRVMYADKPDVAHWRSDAYFYNHYHGTNAPFNLDRHNSTLLDCAGPIPDKYFFLRKDLLRLEAYPRVLQRRRQTIEFYQLPHLAPAAVQCYSHKMLLLTRADVPDEWIYLFNQSLAHLRTPEALESSLAAVLPLHTTLQL
jgi:hypothetical protein